VSTITGLVQFSILYVLRSESVQCQDHSIDGGRGNKYDSEAKAKERGAKVLAWTGDWGKKRRDLVKEKIRG